MTKYNEVFKTKNGTEVKMEITTECSTDKEMRETLSFIACSAHQFYLQAGRAISSTL